MVWRKIITESALRHEIINLARGISSLTKYRNISTRVDAFGVIFNKLIALIRISGLLELESENEEAIVAVCAANCCTD